MSEVLTMEPLPVILRSYSWHQCRRFICLAVKVPGLPDREPSCVSCEFTADTFKLKVCPLKQQQNSVTATSCGDDRNPKGIARTKKVCSHVLGNPDKCCVFHVLFINNLARKVNPDECSYKIRTDEVRVKLAKLVPDEEWLAVTDAESKEQWRKAHIKRFMDEKDKERTLMDSAVNDAVEKNTSRIHSTVVRIDENIPKKLDKNVSIPSFFEEFCTNYCYRACEELMDVTKIPLSRPSHVSPCRTVIRSCDVQPAIHSFYYCRPELVRIAFRRELDMIPEFAILLNVLSQFNCFVLLRCLDSFFGCHEPSYQLDYHRLEFIWKASRVHLAEFWGCLQKEHISFLPNGLRRLGLAVRCKRDYDLLLELRRFPNLDAIDLMVQRSVAPASLSAVPARYTALTLHFHKLADQDMEWMMIVLTRVANKRKPSINLHASLLTASGARVLARRLSNFRLMDIRIEAPLLRLADRGPVEKLFAERALCPCYWSIDLLWGEK